MLVVATAWKAAAVAVLVVMLPMEVAVSGVQAGRLGRGTRMMELEHGAVELRGETDARLLQPA